MDRITTTFIMDTSVLKNDARTHVTESLGLKVERGSVLHSHRKLVWLASILGLLGREVGFLTGSFLKVSIG